MGDAQRENQVIFLPRIFIRGGKIIKLLGGGKGAGIALDKRPGAGAKGGGKKKQAVYQRTWLIIIRASHTSEWIQMKEKEQRGVDQVRSKNWIIEKKARISCA